MYNDGEWGLELPSSKNDLKAQFFFFFKFVLKSGGRRGQMQDWEYSAQEYMLLFVIYKLQSPFTPIVKKRAMLHFSPYDHYS